MRKWQAIITEDEQGNITIKKGPEVKGGVAVQAHPPTAAGFQGAVAPLPREYWNLKKSNPEAASALIGGAGFYPKKLDNGQWVIAARGARSGSSYRGGGGRAAPVTNWDEYPFVFKLPYPNPPELVPYIDLLKQGGGKFRYAKDFNGNPTGGDNCWYSRFMASGLEQYCIKSPDLQATAETIVANEELPMFNTEAVDSDDVPF